MDSEMNMLTLPHSANTLERLTQSFRARFVHGPHFAGIELDQSARSGQKVKGALPFNRSIGKFWRRRKQPAQKTCFHSCSLT